jgi:hypothetical protein
MNLVEDVKILQKCVHSYKVYNKRIMRDKVQQDDFDVKLMQSLDRIENNMDKET